MTCPRCHAEHAPSSKFCPNCGHRLARLCPRCGAPTLGEHRFCGDCGATLAPEPPAERFTHPERYTPKHLKDAILNSKSALEGERKQVTVLLADLKSSLELLADRDPEEAKALLDPVLDRMMEAVHRYEGTVNEVRGDGIMALFGAPLAHEDHALRACYAALRMQEAIGALSGAIRQQHGVSVQIRVGLNSGEVVVRAIRSDLRVEFNAVGQTVHLAGRMEQLAVPGQIFLTEQTHRLVEGLVTVRSLGAVPVKGLAVPMLVHELTGAGPLRSRFQAATARGLTPFVGRALELGELSLAMTRVGGGRGEVRALLGEPGVGKSRLVRELLEKLPVEFRVLEGSTTSFARPAAYLPVIGLLRAYFGLTDADDARGIREKVTATLLDLDASLLTLLAPLLALFDVPADDGGWAGLDPPQRRRRTLDAIRRLLLRESRRQPLCLVVEDLHWIDAETQAVLDALVESIPTAAILLVVTYRPEYAHDWGRKSYYAQLSVPPLTRDSARELLRALLGSDPALAPLTVRLIDRTEGNPFFLEESVRHLAETGGLEGKPGDYHLAGPVAALEVPATVQALVGARIDRLSPEDKRLLQCGAAIGKDIPYDLLAATSELSEDELRRGLRRLQTGEFLYELGLFPQPEYTFAHALTLDVAYGGLLRERRHELHTRLVTALEGGGIESGPERIERLAHHAGRAELWEQAVRYGREAGRRAFARSAHRTAVQHFEEALRALERLPETPETRLQAIDLRLDLRYSLSPLGDFGRMLDYLKEAEALAHRADDPRRLGLVSAFLTNLYSVTLELSLALEYGRRAAAIGGRIRDVTVEAPANSFLALAHYGMTEYRAAADLARRNVERLRGDLARERFGMALLPAVYSATVLMWSLAELGEFDAAAGVGEDAIRLAESVEHPYSQIFARLGPGFLLLRRGEHAGAITHLEQALQVCESFDVAAVHATAAGQLASAYTLADRPDDALVLIRRAVAQAAAIGDPIGHGVRTGTRAEALLAAGRPAEALPLARRGLDLVRLIRGRGIEGWSLRLLGEAAAAQDPPLLDEARASLEAALGIAEAAGMRPLAARARLGLGLVARRAGQAAVSRDHLKRAAAVFEELGMVRWLAEAERAC
jgi:class 3 adenylate cyclase/tetratricopeptide (TPR) repeat protein